MFSLIKVVGNVLPSFTFYLLTWDIVVILWQNGYYWRTSNHYMAVHHCLIICNTIGQFYLQGCQLSKFPDSPQRPVFSLSSVVSCRNRKQYWWFYFSFYDMFTDFYYITFNTEIHMHFLLESICIPLGICIPLYVMQIWNPDYRKKITVYVRV